MIRKHRSWTGRTLAWTWVAAMMALLGAWAGVVLTEVVAPKLTIFVILWGLAAAGPLVATGLWARGEPTRPLGERKEGRNKGVPPARSRLERERRVLGTLWVSSLLAAIVGALVTRWLCPESAVGLPMSMAGLLVVPAAAYTFVTRPASST